MSFYYDLDIELSGGIGVPFKDYTVEIVAEAGYIDPVQAIASFNLRVKNPCYDPDYVQIVTSPLPIGAPHSYTLFEYASDDPYWFLTHDPWTYQTSPTTHTLCGDITYTATFESVTADETSIPVVYHQSNRTFGIYSDDFSLAGMRTIEV